MRSELIPNGEFVTIDGHRMHIFRTGNVNRPKLVFMSGSGTGAPVYDFKVLYEKLSSDFRIIVIEKFGYGYSDMYDGPQDIDTLVEQQRTALQELGEAGGSEVGLTAVDTLSTRADGNHLVFGNLHAVGVG